MHLEGFLWIRIIFPAAQLRTIKGPQANQGVLKNFGEASHNKGRSYRPPHESGAKITENTGVSLCAYLVL